MNDDADNFGLLNAQEATEGKPFSRSWFVSAPWAHPLWHSYLFSLVDLTTSMAKPPAIVLHGATHELIVFALNPKHPNTSWPPHQLTPANHGYQFIAASHEAAEARVLDLIRAVVDRDLSPDTDFTSGWDALFTDGASLRFSAHTPRSGEAVH